MRYVELQIAATWQRQLELFLLDISKVKKFTPEVFAAELGDPLMPPNGTKKLMKRASFS